MINYICRYCEEKVSPRAHTCPHCGEPKPAIEKTNPFSKFLRITGITLMVLSIFYWGFDIMIINGHPMFYALAAMLGVMMILKSKARPLPE